MLEFKMLEELKPNKEILEVIKDYKFKAKNGKIKTLLNTNLEFIIPTTYSITSPTKITILEYKINEINGKPYYIKEYNKKYNLKELKQILINLTNSKSNHRKSGFEWGTIWRK